MEQQGIHRAFGASSFVEYFVLGVLGSWGFSVFRLLLGF